MTWCFEELAVTITGPLIDALLPLLLLLLLFVVMAMSVGCNLTGCKEAFEEDKELRIGMIGELGTLDAAGGFVSWGFESKLFELDILSDKGSTGVVEALEHFF